MYCGRHNEPLCPALYRFPESPYTHSTYTHSVYPRSSNVHLHYFDKHNFRSLLHSCGIQHQGKIQALISNSKSIPYKSNPSHNRLDDRRFLEIPSMFHVFASHNLHGDTQAECPMQVPEYAKLTISTIQHNAIIRNFFILYLLNCQHFSATIAFVHWNHLHVCIVFEFFLFVNIGFYFSFLCFSITL